jgi:hypothetical protein
LQIVFCHLTFVVSLFAKPQAVCSTHSSSFPWVWISAA